MYETAIECCLVPDAPLRWTTHERLDLALVHLTFWRRVSSATIGCVLVTLTSVAQVSETPVVWGYCTISGDRFWIRLMPIRGD